MKGLTTDEYAATIGSFVDVEDETPPLAVVDRSTLERYATCPAQARFIEAGLCIDSSEEAESGNAVHEAVSQGVSLWVDSRGAQNVLELRAEMEAALYAARPDIQPDAIRGLRASLWSIAKLITSIHPQNILAYDGGDGERSGQLAIDIPHLGLRATSEVDFLEATAAPQLVRETDWKSGHKHYTVAAVRDSFQFGMHAVLIFDKFTTEKSSVESVQVTVWHTRSNRRQWAVEFRRDDLPALRARLLSAAGYWAQYHAVDPFSAPTWPTEAKCSLCPAAAICPAANRTTTVAANPTLAVDNRIVIAEALTSLDSQLTAYVKQHGPVRGSNGELYGVKPPSGRATYGVYHEAGTEEPIEGSDDGLHD